MTFKFQRINENQGFAHGTEVMYMCDENYFGQAGSFTKECFD